MLILSAMITIYSAQDSVLLALSDIGTGSKGYYSLMQHDYIVLKFNLQTPVDFGIGSYVDLTGQFDEALGGKLSRKYYVTEKQTPTYNTSTGGYEYQLRMNAYYWLWNNYIFKYLPETPGSEASWTLTAALDVHLGVFLRNLKALGFKFNQADFSYSIDGTVVNKAVTMTYDNIHLLDALFSLGAESAFDCDVWITENVIHFGRCEFGDAIKIERGVEADNITRTESKGKFATRIYAFGSSRNIPSDYRPIEEQAVVNGVVQKRLMLPEGTPYVDAYDNMPQNEVVEDVVVFDDIYPRRVGTLSDVTSRTETVENEDGTESTYTYYRYKDTGLAFDDKYILEGQELRIVFQSGKLNGMDFGVIFEPEGTEKGSQIWEIVGNEDYGRFLPDTVLAPENGDEYVLYGFDIQLVSDQYIPEAEQELLQRAEEYVAKTKVDDGTYTVPLLSSWVYEDQLHRTFDVGQKVSLIAPDFFTDGRVSRIIGWEMCLDIPYDKPIYTIGESARYSRLGDIEDKIDTLTYKGQTYTGNGSGVYVIRTNDSTPASDSNVYSALRALSMFLRKDVADTAQGLIKLMQGAETGDFIDSMLAGKGTGIMPEGRIQTDRLEVRDSMTVMDLIINRIQGMESDYSFTEVGKIKQVDDLGENTYRLWIEKRTDFDFIKFQENDVCYSIINTLYKGGTDYFTSWMRVLGTNVTDNTATVVLYADSDVPGGRNYAPVAGYNLTRRGNAEIPDTDAGGTNERSQSWLLSSSEGRIMFLSNVFKPILEDYNYKLVVGKLPNLPSIEKLPVSAGEYGIMADVVIAQNFYEFDGNGELITKKVDRGEWSYTVAISDAPYRNTTYSYTTPAGANITRLEQHTVYHLGCKWGCLTDKTTTEPKWNSADWEMLEGDPNYYLQIESSNGYAFRRSSVDTDLEAKIFYGNIDITTDIMATVGTDVTWTRDTGQTADDNTWQPSYVDDAKNVIHIDNSSEHGIGSGFGIDYKTAAFTCTVFVPVGGSAEKTRIEGDIKFT